MNDDKLMSTVQGFDWFILLLQGIEPYGWIRICTRLHTDTICFRHYLFDCTQLSLSPAAWGPKRSISPNKKILIFLEKRKCCKVGILIMFICAGLGFFRIIKLLTTWLTIWASRPRLEINFFNGNQIEIIKNRCKRPFSHQVSVCDS